jgi:RimJ/RimL family protein N-acetyltransferase
MEVREGDVVLRLGPIRREDVHRYISPDVGFGLQSYEVSKYLAPIPAPTLAFEEQWWDRASTSEDQLHWGLYLPDGDDGWKLVGTTTIGRRAGGRRGESGFLLFDRAHWRQRVASTAHLARTLHAFRELDLLAVDSSALADNVGSNRALTGVGYVQTGVVYGNDTVGGRPRDSIQYLLVNPEEEAWRYFWRRPEDEIPPDFHAARAIALRTLERAEAAVTYL